MTEKIIGAAIEVHKALGPRLLESSFLESIYESALVIELRERETPSSDKSSYRSSIGAWESVFTA